MSNPSRTKPSRGGRGSAQQKKKNAKATPKKSFKRIFLRWLLIIALLVMIVPVGCWVWVESRAAGRITADVEQVRFTPVALVLGTSPGTEAKPNAYFENRMDATSVLYHAGKIEHILVSGDNSAAYYNEVGAMRKALIKRGVPEDLIEGDDAGLRTLDSVLRARDVFNNQEILIVSQHFHTARAISIARHHGIEARGFAAADVSQFFMIRTMVREIGARMKMVADLYFFNTSAGEDPGDDLLKHMHD